MKLDITVKFHKLQLHKTTWVFLTNIMLKKSDLQKDILHDSFYMKFKIGLTKLWGEKTEQWLPLGGD